MLKPTIDCEVICIGAGPAGLTAAYLLSKRQVSVTVLEADPTYVGGISRTVTYKGFSFDIGGHRFFSKSQAVEDLWSEILPDDFLHRPRSSRILYRGCFYSYPLRALEALGNLGLIEAARCMLSFAKAKAFPVAAPRTFKEWVSNQFGARLFSIFFKTYTEKVWGMSCDDISADWAAQRIKGLSLGGAVINALGIDKFKARLGGRQGVIKSLIESFRYPRRGPGMMWDAAARKVRENGGHVLLGAKVTGLALDVASGVWSVTYASDGGARTLRCRHVVSSAPLNEIMTRIEPTAQSAVAAAQLRYRDFLTVALIVRAAEAFDDNWIYIHEPDVRVGRVQNFRSWSPEMVPDPALACYGLEYFCNAGDSVWTMTDQDLIALAKAELAKLGLAREGTILDGCVVRQAKAYPVYDEHYAAHVETIRAEITQRYPGLHPVGRNGMHKYNNQDHAMMTAMLTVENILAGRVVFDVWKVNQDAEYHETNEGSGRNDAGGGASGLRQYPGRAA